MLLDFMQHQESHIPYKSEEPWMSLLFLKASLRCQPLSLASWSRVLSVSAGANFQGNVLLCPAASYSTVSNICRRVAWQKHTMQQLRVIITSPNMAILLFITGAWLRVWLFHATAHGCMRRIQKTKQKIWGCCKQNLKTQKVTHLSHCQKSALGKGQDVASSYLQALCAFSPALAVSSIPLPGRGLLSKRGWIRSKRVTVALCSIQS